MMKTTLARAAVLGGLLVCAAHANAVPALSFTGGHDSSNSGGDFVYGWAFDVSAATSVAQLGMFDFGSPGFAEAHEIGLWSAGGSLLASATIGPGTAAPLIDGFRYVDIVDIVLGVGTDYVLGVNNMDVDRLILDADSVSTVGSIAFAESRFIDSGGVLARPINSIGDLKYFGPNFLTADPVTSAVVEPSSAALLVLGLLGVARRRRN